MSLPNYGVSGLQLQYKDWRLNLLKGFSLNRVCRLALTSSVVSSPLVWYLETSYCGVAVELKAVTELFCKIGKGVASSLKSGSQTFIVRVC